MTIRSNGTVKTISINQRKGPLPKLPEVLVCYNLAEGLTVEEEDHFIRSEEDLFAVGTITLSENLHVSLPDGVNLYQADLGKADFATANLKANLDNDDLATTSPPTLDSATYQEHFYKFTEREEQIVETPVRDKLGEMKVAAWNQTEEEQLRKINVGTEEAPQILKISTQLELTLAQAVEDQLREYTDVLAWTYKDLKGIPPSVA